jgi:hypothetical protein
MPTFLKEALLSKKRRKIKPMGLGFMTPPSQETWRTTKSAAGMEFPFKTRKELVKSRRRRRVSSGAEERLWIQKAVRKPGALRRTVMEKYGAKGFTKKGTIKKEVLTELAKNGVTGRRARMAITLSKLRKKK